MNEIKLISDQIIQCLETVEYTKYELYVVNNN